MQFRTALLAATVLAAPVAAKAQAINGVYIGAGAGANFMQDESIDRVTRNGPPGRQGGGNSVNLDTGFVGVASVGYGFGNGLRVELEGNYRQNKLSRAGANSAGGDEQKYGAFVNALYDFDPNLFGAFIPFPVTPYVGVGAGYQHTQLKNARFYNGGFGPAPGFPGGYSELYRTNDGTDNFAYQAIVGASFPISAVPGLALTAEYRFMGIAGDRDYNFQYFAPNTATRAKVKLEDNYNHSLLLGVRYAFNAAPPPPPPAPAPMAAPAPAPARTYLVFFDWDRADLTDRARQIITEAAQASTRVQVTRIEVNGYTDKSGTPRYNQGLSVRRANAVAAELVRQGVPRAAITTQGFGENNPLVPTADGVREPQNRRVEIIFR